MPRPLYEHRCLMLRTRRRGAATCYYLRHRPAPVTFPARELLRIRHMRFSTGGTVAHGRQGHADSAHRLPSASLSTRQADGDSWATYLGDAGLSFGQLCRMPLHTFTPHLACCTWPRSRCFVAFLHAHALQQGRGGRAGNVRRWRFAAKLLGDIGQARNCAWRTAGRVPRAFSPTCKGRRDTAAPPTTWLASAPACLFPFAAGLAALPASGRVYYAVILRRLLHASRSPPPSTPPPCMWVAVEGVLLLEGSYGTNATRGVHCINKPLLNSAWRTRQAYAARRRAHSAHGRALLLPITA